MDDDLFASELRDELPWLEGTMLTAMRTWVLGCKRGVSAEAPVQMIFAHLRASEAAGHLDRFMQALSTGCTRMINIYCTCEPVVGADEMLLLDAFAMTQEELHDAAAGLLQRLVTPATAYAASGDALAIVQTLKNAGHVMARGPAARRRHGHDGAGDSFAASRTLRRLH